MIIYYLPILYKNLKNLLNDNELGFRKGVKIRVELQDEWHEPSYTNRSL